MNAGQDELGDGIFELMFDIYRQAFGIYWRNAGIIEKKRVSRVWRAVFFVETAVSVVVMAVFVV